MQTFYFKIILSFYFSLKKLCMVTAFKYWMWSLCAHAHKVQNSTQLNMCIVK